MSGTGRACRHIGVGYRREMAQSIHIEEQAGILVIRVTGSLGSEEARQAIEKTRSDTPASALPRLWDLSAADADLSRDEIRRIADLAQREEHSPARIAMLVSGDLAFGQTRILGVFRETERTEVQVFRDEASARHWLRGGGSL